MSSESRRRWWPWVEIGWVCFVAANLVALESLGDWETVPFHFIWVSLMVLYGFRVWSPAVTAVVLVAICLLTGGALADAVVGTDAGVDELTEVPLMAGMFLAMVWHARRRQAALADVQAARVREHRFLRDASHQVRTPITVARCHTELILESPEEQTCEAAAVVLDELDRLARLTSHMLAVAAARDPDLVCRREELDLGEQVRAVVRRWSAVRSRDWQADVKVEGVVRADRERLLGALDALLENAMLATTDGDRITVALDAHDGFAVLSVIDGGVGIPTADVDRIFEPFATMRPHAHLGPRGTGLGLVLVKTVAEGHGGCVDIACGPGGHETVITMRLPGFVPSVRGRFPVRREGDRRGRRAPAGPEVVCQPGTHPS